MIQNFLDLWNHHRDTVFEVGMEITASVIVIVISVLVSRGLKRLIRKASKSRLNVNGTATLILSHVVTYGIFIICIVIILNIFGINTTSLIAVLGAAGLAIALALKDTMGNIASGIVLFFMGSYRLGEFVEFGSFSGTVREINLFATILETPDGVYISAPNSSIWGSPIKNYSRNGRRRMEISVRISYSDSLDTAFQTLKEIIACEQRFLQEPSPQIIVQSFQDSCVNLVIRAWADSDQYWDVYWNQMRGLKEKIETAGLHIPFPQRDVHVFQ
jgi:small conductance mechanosensitive channel